MSSMSFDTEMGCNVAMRGRPRAFDRTEALRQAMTVFWERGYEGASISDLSAAMGISSPSLYAAFGCKEQLLREAVALYNEIEGADIAAALRRLPTAREAIAEVLRRNAVAYTDPGKPTGCMIVLTATTYTEGNRAVHDHLADWRMSLERDFRERLERGIADGDVPAGADAATIAAFYNTVNHGMAIQARDGTDRPTLSAVAEAAIAAWDGLVGSAVT
jgi:AcrR family transcriptional regulator